MAQCLLSLHNPRFHDDFVTLELCGLCAAGFLVFLVSEDPLKTFHASACMFEAVKAAQ